MGNNKLEGYILIDIFLFFFPSAGQFGSRFKASLYGFTDLVIIGKQRKDQYILAEANGLSKKPVGTIRPIPKSPESPRRSGGI